MVSGRYYISIVSRSVRFYERFFGLVYSRYWGGSPVGLLLAGLYFRYVVVMFDW